MKRVQARADLAQNRLYITVGGRLTKKDLDSLYTDIRFCVSDLQPGFTVITDLTQCSLAALSAISTFKKITRHLVDNRPGLIIRVINTNNLVVRQLLNLTARIGGYKALQVSTMEEAEELAGNSGPTGELNFFLPNQLATLRTDQDKGNGIVTEMSVSGCKLESSSISPEPDTQISLELKFRCQEGLIDHFSCNGEVTSIDEDGCLFIKFHPLAREKKEELWNRIVRDSESDPG